MLVMIPKGWEKHFLKNTPYLRTFGKDTPIDIIEKAKTMNVKMMKYEGEPFYHFERPDGTIE